MNQKFYRIYHNKLVKVLVTFEAQFQTQPECLFERLQECTENLSYYYSKVQKEKKDNPNKIAIKNLYELVLILYSWLFMFYDKVYVNKFQKGWFGHDFRSELGKINKGQVLSDFDEEYSKIKSLHEEKATNINHDYIKYSNIFNNTKKENPDTIIEEKSLETLESEVKIHEDLSDSYNKIIKLYQDNCVVIKKINKTKYQKIIKMVFMFIFSFLVPLILYKIGVFS